MKNSKHSRIIDKIEKIRSKIMLIGWIFLRLSFKLDPKSISQDNEKINYDDKRISSLLKKLTD